MPVPLRSIAACWVRNLGSSPSKVGRMPHRVRLRYLDSNLHMNYASYLEVMELARWNWSIQNRVLRHWFRDRLAPVVIHVDIRYRRELRPLQRFVVDTRLVTLERRTGIFQQHLVVGDQVHAKADIRFTLLREGRMIDTASLDRSLGAWLASPLATSGGKVRGL